MGSLECCWYGVIKQVTTTVTSTNTSIVQFTSIITHHLKNILNLTPAGKRYLMAQIHVIFESLNSIPYFNTKKDRDSYNSGRFATPNILTVYLAYPLCCSQFGCTTFQQIGCDDKENRTLVGSGNEYITRDMLILSPFIVFSRLIQIPQLSNLPSVSPIIKSTPNL